MAIDRIAPASVHPTALVARNVVIGEGASVGPYAIVGDDGDGPTTVCQGAIVRGHAHVSGGVTIGREAEVGPGAVISNDVPPYAIVHGNPASIVGYSAALESAQLVPIRASEAAETRTPTGVGGAQLIRLPSAVDLRGALVVAEFDSLPFSPRRLFAVHDVTSGNVRGEHAHRSCEQLLLALSGTVRCIVDDATLRREVILDSSSVGLHVPAMIWGTQFGHSADAALVVLASQPYDADDYIRDYEEFLEVVNAVAVTSQHENSVR